MPSTAYFLDSSDYSALAMIPSVISQWEKNGYIGLSVPPPTPYVGRGDGEANHTFPLMTGGDRWRGPKVHSFGSTQSYFPDVPVGAETIRTIVRVCPLLVPPLFPPHNHLWGSARTGRSSPNPCAQREKVSLLINPPRTGRTDLSNV